MNYNLNKAYPVVILILLFSMQSCTTFRTHLDNACVSQFAKEYPNPQESYFVLPWQVGESYRLTQGNCTLESHSLVNKQQMSFDFRMPIGTPLVAVQDGRVAAVIEHFRDNVDNDFDQANLIGIEHDGGVISWYMHLKFEGAAVAVDDKVSQGDIIGYSGNTGDSAYPHLHFYAQQIIEECNVPEKRTVKLELCPPLPVSFSNISPNHTVLMEWQTYTAGPYK